MLQVAGPAGVSARAGLGRVTVAAREVRAGGGGAARAGPPSAGGWEGRSAASGASRVASGGSLSGVSCTAGSRVLGPRSPPFWLSTLRYFWSGHCLVFLGVSGGGGGVSL